MLDPNHNPEQYKQKLIEGFKELHARWMTELKLLAAEGYEGAPKEVRAYGLRKLAPLQEELTRRANEVKNGEWPAEVEPLVKEASLTCARLWVSIAKVPEKVPYFDRTKWVEAPSTSKNMN